MTTLEEQVSALLKEAPGDPPLDLDADALVARCRTRRRRWVAPALAAAAVLVLGVSVAVWTWPEGRTHTTNATDRTPPRPKDPKAAAEREAHAILDGISLPPGTHRAGTEYGPAVRAGAHTGLSSLQAMATGSFQAPGSVDGVVRYARAHPPKGFVVNCICGARTSPTVTFLNSAEDAAIDYTVAPRNAGVVIQIEVVVAWIPVRPQWTYVGNAVGSVDVSIVREVPAQTRPVTPVRRTLTGDKARRLAATVDALPAEALSTPSCPAPDARRAQVSYDVRFRVGGRVLVFDMPWSCSPQVSVTESRVHHAAVYLAPGHLADELLAALGLPANYGR